MNKAIYRLVWNSTLGAPQVVSEVAKSKTCGGSVAVTGSGTRSSKRRAKSAAWPLALLSLGIVSAACATVPPYDVTTGEDSGAGSLRDQLVTSGTVNIDPGVSTITLDMDLPVFNGATTLNAFAPLAITGGKLEGNYNSLSFNDTGTGPITLVISGGFTGTDGIGATGGAGISGSSFTMTNYADISGGSGGTGTGTGGIGGAGISGSSFTATNYYYIGGGTGGTGGTGTGTGTGGIGGIGGAGISGSTFTVTNDSNIVGGTGGSGGDSIGGRGGIGGTGGAGISGSSFTVTNNFNIVGGRGGRGGYSGTGPYSGNGGIGGNGGAGISGTSMEVVNTWTIQGGAGGAAGDYTSNSGQAGVGIFVQSGNSTITNDGTISGYNGIQNEGTITTLTNSDNGSISGNDDGDDDRGVGIVNEGTITTLINSGYISGSAFGIDNADTITTLSNAVVGSITAGYAGIHNTGSIGALTNSGGIWAEGFGIDNAGTITTLSNAADGTISVGYTGIHNTGSIGALTNSGTISGGSAGIVNGTTTSGASSSIGTLTNDGQITGNIGIGNGNSITTLSNAAGGTITGGLAGIYNVGSIGALSNSGLITGNEYAIYNDTNATLGTITNSSTIAGTIENDNASQDLMINGGTDSQFGTLTGFSSGTGVGADNIGLITNTLSNVVFGPGNQLLNDHINVGTHTVTNDATGVLQVNNTINITGNYHQGADASLILGVASNAVTNGDGGDSGYGRLVVSGTANIASGSTIGLQQLGSYGFAQGQRYLVIQAATPGTEYNASSLRYTVAGYNATGTSVPDGSNTDLLVTVGSATSDGGTPPPPVVTPPVVVVTPPVVTPPVVVVTPPVVTPPVVVVTPPVVTPPVVVVTPPVVTPPVVVVTPPVVTPPVVVVTPPVVTPPVVVVTPPVVTPPVVTTPVVTTPVGPINQATTAGGVTTLAGLFNYSGYDAKLMNLFNAAAALPSPAAGDKAGAQLSPVATASAATQASTASTGQVLNVVAAHSDKIRTLLHDSGASSGISTGEAASTSGLWGQAFGGTSRLSESNNIAGYHSHYSGLLIGADGAVNDSWQAGGLISYTDTTVNSDGNNTGSSADVKSYGLFGYASYQAQPWYLDLSLGAVQHQYDTQREINFPGFNAQAKGKHDGMQYIASAQAGYPFDLGNHTVLTPIAALTYSTLDEDSFTEKGGNGAALHVDSTSTHSLKSDLGTKLEHSFATSYGNVVPSAKLAWRHEYQDTRLQSVANFAADTAGATSFSSPGAKPVSDTGEMVLGVTLMHSNALSVSTRYTLEAGNGYTANTGDVQVRWNF
ncbi:outer membrane autotransporter protein [Pseudomonas corrugata]|uniref:autotransporter domain-containing protein n=1 Tax=Pseudomonas corrugata TaxID=47879 RepID=UPI0028542A0D|nr:autotransporter domain-containing protein [Pseudomonas corrugata]MDR7282961.1 outer membrane autotransporter protein [Pseudomonas corrugata]